MKKNLLVVMMLVFTNTACINDGALPLEDTPDAAVPPTEPDACPTPAEEDANVTPTTDATVVNPADAAPVPAVDASMPAPTPDATVVPDACPPPPAPTLVFTATPTTITVGGSSELSWSTTNATSCALGGGSPNGSVVVTPIITTTFSTSCFGPGGSVSAWITVTVNPTPVCHGLYVTFTATDVTNMDHCTGWTATGTGMSLPMALQVGGASGVDGVCAITCNRVGTGETMLPTSVSGVWEPGASADVTRWYTTGCTRLPDHPAAEPNQAGGTWDGRCDNPVTILTGSPTP